jgi:ferredoxin
MAIRKIIEIDEKLCDGCGLCIPSCAEGALAIVDGKAKLVKDIYCDGLGACLGECPQGALKVIEREAEDFDEAAVEQALEERAQAGSQAPAAPAESRLRQWPVQLSLVPPFAPFLRGADLLITADCVPFAYPNYHADFLEGRVVLVGCPKLDDLPFYVKKLQAIFEAAKVKSVTVLKMEVPCCTGIAQAARIALDATPYHMQVRCVTIRVDGAIQEDVTMEPGSSASLPQQTSGCGGGCPSVG